MEAIPGNGKIVKVHFFKHPEFTAPVDHYYEHEPLTSNGPMVVFVTLENTPSELRGKLPNYLRIPKEAEFIEC